LFIVSFVSFILADEETIADVGSLQLEEPKIEEKDCKVPDPWVIPFDHIKRMFATVKVGQSLHLTEGDQDSFGIGLITPAVTRLVGFGEFATNMTFTIKITGDPDCARFLVDYGAKRSCFYSKRSRPAPQRQDEPVPFVHVVNPPDFGTKPMAWPCPPDGCPCEDDEPEPIRNEPHDMTADDMKAPADCDGVSLALIADKDAPGVFLAKDGTVLYAGDESLFSSKESVQIKMEYTPPHEDDGHFMRFYIDDAPISEKIPFSTSEDIGTGDRVFPKITLAAGSGKCGAIQEISEVYFEMEKVVSCALFDDGLKANLLSVEEDAPANTDMTLFYDQKTTKSSLQSNDLLHINWLAATAFFIGLVAVVVQQFQKSAKPSVEKRGAYAEI